MCKTHYLGQTLIDWIFPAYWKWNLIFGGQINDRKTPTNSQYFVYEFLFDENTELNVKRFDTLSEDWLEFIKENREKGGLQHNYDVVIGPVADDNTMETVQLYIANILTSKEAVERLRYNKVNNQVSFHTEKALKYLKLVRREHYGNGNLLL